MKLAMIGFGQAGGKVVDKFLEYDKRTGSEIVRAAAAVNTAKADLMGSSTSLRTSACSSVSPG